MMRSIPARPAILARYKTPRELATRARRRPFQVTSVGSALVVTPSTGRPRKLHEHEFEQAVPLIDGATRGPLQSATYNSSYVEAIVDDIRGG
jgi:hypothetical protein